LKKTDIQNTTLRRPKGKHDPENQLNDLTGTEWIKRTKSVWYSKPPIRDPLKSQHPATFAESDIEELIKFFTKSGQSVLDPFVGVGSTLIACYNTGRHGIGIELIDKWVEIAKKRLKKFTSQTKLGINQTITKRPSLEIIKGDAREEMKKLQNESFDFIVTSPPYWKILTKAKDHKTKKERLSKGLPTKYSENVNDLGNIEDYNTFLSELQKVWQECYRVLKKGKYMCIIVSDFRNNSQFVMYHADIVRIVCEVGFVLKGVNILVQDNKKLYPYGYPYDFVPNIHHQYILIFKKE